MTTKSKPALGQIFSYAGASYTALHYVKVIFKEGRKLLHYCSAEEAQYISGDGRTKILAPVDKISIIRNSSQNPSVMASFSAVAEPLEGQAIST